MRGPWCTLLCLWVLPLVCCQQIHALAVAVSDSDNPPALRRLQDGADDAPVPVFCLNVGVEIAFPSQDVLDTLDDSAPPVAGTGCLRNPLMAAVVTHLKPSLRTYSVHATDCVLEPLDAESFTVALFGVVSICSRSNMDVENDLDGWSRDAKAQVDALFEREPRITVGKTTGMRRHVLVSSPYALPVSGNALPQLILGETQIWSDGGEDDNAAPVTESPSYFTHVTLDVQNGGAIPLHLYRLTLVDRADGEGGTTSTDMMAGSVLSLVTPAVVHPGTSDVITFKAITTTAVASSKSYSLYISHSGFRAHLFTGMLDGTAFLAREKPFRGEEEDDDGAAFARFAGDSDTTASLLTSFPYATWRVASVVVVLLVGLAVAWYSRRKFVGFRAVKRALATCVQSKGWKTMSSSNSEAASAAQEPARAAATSSQVAASRAAIADRGEGHIEMESFLPKTSVAKLESLEVEPKQVSTPAPSTRMPVITMNWKAPPPTAPAPSAIDTYLAAPKLVAKKAWQLNLDGTAKLHPKRFESMWDEYVQRYQVEVSEMNAPKSDDLLAKLEAQGVSCMASGAVGGVDKYVFYAKQRGCAWFYLATVDITVATAKVAISVRTSGDTAEELVQQLVELIRATLATHNTS